MQSESFRVGDQLVEHVAGQSVGNVMQRWRELRRQEPELFGGVRVWQSPTAFADSVIYAWQQQEESARFENLVRIVDGLRTHWTEQAAERNWLSQTMQQCVPLGCTPLVQVTDTGLAMPAKAAARATHDRQRDLLRLKARQEKTKAVYKCGPREVLQTAQAMHFRMVALNSERQTVLAEARACGWLHWRPNPERVLLEPASSQAWAKPLTEGSSRMGPEFRVNRDSWVEAGVPKPLEGRQLKEGEPLLTEVDYFGEKTGEVDTLVLAAEPDLLSPEEQLRVEAALLHPSCRSKVEARLAQLAYVLAEATGDEEQHTEED